MATNGKTIKQIADELSVSKQAVRDKIAKLGLHGTLRKIGNQLCISKTQETLIKSAFSENQSQSKNANQLCENDNHSQTTLQLISMLQNELNEKNSIINAQQKTIDNLTDTVNSQAQSINADRHNQLAETIQQQFITDKITQPNGQELSSKKKRWWKKKKQP